MSKPKPDPPTTFVQIQRAAPEPEPAAPRASVLGEPGFRPREATPEWQPRDAPASAHLGRFSADPATAAHRRRSMKERHRGALLLLTILLMLTLGVALLTLLYR